MFQNHYGFQTWPDNKLDIKDYKITSVARIHVYVQKCVHAKHMDKLCIGNANKGKLEFGPQCTDQGWEAIFGQNSNRKNWHQLLNNASQRFWFNYPSYINMSLSIRIFRYYQN